MSDESEDDYAEFGTPLEPLDEDVCPRKKPFTIEEQFARDKHGRRRFHGAFTGGFSAGFLNTVGSLEGWKPSSFKSSKTEKGAAVVQRPEHFMDEEDIGEFGIAPSVLRAKEDYHNTLKTKRKYQDYQSASGLGASVLKSLLQPVRETVGIKLLRKMGWKPGQGVGPRITKHEKQRISKIRKKVYGCLLPNERSDGEDSDSDIDDEELENLTFAPNDYPFQQVVPKENLFGIGYKGLDKRSILSVPQSKPDFHLRSKQTITGQAFGVGAFEEEDEDIYSREDMSQYDFILGDNNKEGGSASDCITGEDLYDAFAPALKRKVKKLFPPPVLPENFKPVKKSSRFEPLPDTHKSRKLSPSPERKSKSEETEEIQKEARKLTENTLGTSQSVFKPFISDMDKQVRYEKYLRLLMIGKQDGLNNLQPITMTEWEKERERIEFEQAAKLFKPLSGIMEDRFTVGSQHDDINDPLATVEKLKSGSDDEIKAAKMNMYGRLTRTVEDWKPCSLLCKRFNIRELSINEIPIVKNKPKYSIFDDIMTPIQEEKNRPPENQEILCIPKETEESEKIIQPAQEPEKLELSKLPENKIDLFNAIFLDSDSEEDEEQVKSKDATSKEDVKEYDKQVEMPYEDRIVNDKRNTSPARGIFENIDYNFLLSNKQVNETSTKCDGKASNSGVNETNDDKDKDIDMGADTGVDINEELVYGPKLPDKFPPKKIDFIPEPVDNDYWVEKTAHRKHKKKHKHKKSKHKSKHKNRDKS